MEDYIIQRKLGHGAQGVVYKVTHRPTSKDYAMKVIRCAGQEQVNVALKEIKVLLQLRHSNIVSYIDFFLVFNSAKTRQEFALATEETAISVGNTSALKDYVSKDSMAPIGSEHLMRLYSLPESANLLDRCGEHDTLSVVNHGLQDTAAPALGEKEIAVCLVMELCVNGDMQEMIRETKQKYMIAGKHPLSEAQVLSWMEQCAAALQYIHEKGFLHRDLKPTNIFFDADRNVKVGDFGLAAAVGYGRQSMVGTPYYLAPERMLQQRYDSKVDIWGLGVIILEVLTLREQPINSMILENPLVVESIMDDVTSMGFSKKLACLLRDMLLRYPEGRPNPSAVLQRLAAMPSASARLGMSLSVLMGMSCPKTSDAVCQVCEVELSTVVCATCSAMFCEDCDRIRHRHHSRQSHDRTSVPSAHNTTSASSQPQQLTLSSSRTTAGGLHDITDQFQNYNTASSVYLEYSIKQRSNELCGMDVKSLSDGLGMAPGVRLPTYNNFSNQFLGASMSISDFVLSQSPLRRGAETIVRVPQDFSTMEAALAAVKNLPHVRKVLVSGGTLHSVALMLTDSLPENIRIVGENPSPVLEVGGSPYAVLCRSGKGTLENITIRHVGYDTTAGPGKKQPRPTAVSITGGEWRLHRCRISCVGGSGVSVGVNRKHVLDEEATGVTDCPRDSEETDPTSVDPVITKCLFVDISTAGVVVLEGARGSYEANRFTGCGCAAFLLKRNSAARVRGNHITDGSETGIFCQDACGTVELNLIEANRGCGVVVKGPCAAALFSKNKVLSNTQAGFFCCEQASPFISENEIRLNGKAGILIKTKASPKVTKNVIRSGKEAGIYVFEQGAGIIEENHIEGNHNAGVLVTTRGNPHVIRNIIQKNAYEGVWVCKDGRGTFCDNDLRYNVKGPMDVCKDSTVAWITNTEI